MPKVAEMSPIEVATRSRGNSSRMIPKASGKIAPAAPWMARPEDQHADGPADRAHERAQREHAEHAEQHPLLAVHVAETAEQRRGDAGGEQEGGEQPGGGLGRGAHVVLDRRQRRDDHRLGQRVRDRAQDEDAERAVRVGAIRAGLRGRAHGCRSSMAAASECSSRAADSRSLGDRRRKTSSRALAMRRRLAATRLRPSSVRRDLHAPAVAVLGADALGHAALHEPVEHARRRGRGHVRRLGQRAEGQRPAARGQRLEQVELRGAQLGRQRSPVEASRGRCGAHGGNRPGPR